MWIRSVQPADTEAILALWRVVLPGYDDPHRPQRDPRANIARKLAHRDGLFWVALDDDPAGPPLGTVMAGYDGHRGWLYCLAVHPDRRRAGIGWALVRHAEAALTALGCPKVNLQVHRDDPRAWAFWRAAGYLDDEVVGLGRRMA